MDLQEVEKIGLEIKEYPIDIIIGLWFVINEEIKRRMEKKE